MRKRVMAFREVYQIFSDVWRLYRKYAGGSLTESECREAVEAAEQLRKKYHSILADEVLTAAMCELSRIAKNKL